MRTSLLVVGALCVLGSFASSQRGRRSVLAQKLDHFTISQVELSATSLNAGRTSYWIYLPKEYGDTTQKSVRFPWIIWLHGMNEDGRRFHDSGGGAVLDALRQQGKVPPLVFVCPSAPRRTLYVNREPSGDIEDLIVHDVRKHVEANYRVATERGLRALMGVSIGGHGALKIALKRRSLFGVVAAHSAAIMPADPENLPPRYQRYAQFMGQGLGVDQIFGRPIDKKKWGAEMPMALVASLQQAAGNGVATFFDLGIYFDAGTDDRYGFAPLNEDFSKLLRERGIPHKFRLIEGGGHSWGSGSLQQQLPISLEFVAAHWAAAGRTKPAAQAPATQGKRVEPASRPAVRR